MTDPDKTSFLNPAQLVVTATAENAARRAELLEELLLDPAMPRAMREDTRMRLTDLTRRFPEVLGDDEGLPAE